MIINKKRFYLSQVNNNWYEVWYDNIDNLHTYHIDVYRKMQNEESNHSDNFLFAMLVNKRNNNISCSITQVNYSFSELDDFYVLVDRIKSFITTKLEGV